jgi:hypothetical protein
LKRVWGLILNLFKTLLTLLLAVAFASGGSVVATAAAPKAGAKCTYAGQLQTVGAKKFACVAKGKKLVWNSGSKVLSLDTITPAAMRKAAYAEFFKDAKTTGAYKTDVQLIVGPTASKARANTNLKSLNKAVSFFSDIFQPTKVFAVYVAEGDLDWVDNALCQQAKYCNGKYGKWSDQIRRGISEGACTSGQAIVSDTNLPIAIQCIGNHSDETQNKQTTPHEFTHSVQQLASNIDSSPRWLSEGSAVLFGAYLALSKSQSIPNDLDFFLDFDKNSFLTRQDICNLATKTVDEITKCFSSSDLMRNPLPREKLSMLNAISYYPGAIATEALLAVYGTDAFKKFTADLKTTSFPDAFMNNFGLSVEAFYGKISNFMIKHIL